MRDHAAAAAADHLAGRPVDRDGRRAKRARVPARRQAGLARQLPAQPTTLDVTYTAVGKGLYELSVAPGGLLDQYKVSLTANGSDVRLLELSLQPTSLERLGRQQHYRWDYKRLLFGRPVRMDVLGIAPIDRLGELTWLGPVSVVAFGLLVGLVVQAASVPRFDRWMLLLTSARLPAPIR